MIEPRTRGDERGKLGLPLVEQSDQSPPSNHIVTFCVRVCSLHQNCRYRHLPPNHPEAMADRARNGKVRSSHAHPAASSYHSLYSRHRLVIFPSSICHIRIIDQSYSSSSVSHIHHHRLVIFPSSISHIPCTIDRSSHGTCWTLLTYL